MPLWKTKSVDGLQDDDDAPTGNAFSRSKSVSAAPGGQRAPRASIPHWYRNLHQVLMFDDERSASLDNLEDIVDDGDRVFASAQKPRSESVDMGSLGYGSAAFPGRRPLRLPEIDEELRGDRTSSRHRQKLIEHDTIDQNIDHSDSDRLDDTFTANNGLGSRRSDKLTSDETPTGGATGRRTSAKNTEIRRTDSGKETPPSGTDNSAGSIGTRGRQDTRDNGAHTDEQRSSKMLRQPSFDELLRGDADEAQPGGAAGFDELPNGTRGPIAAERARNSDATDQDDWPSDGVRIRYRSPVDVSQQDDKSIQTDDDGSTWLSPNDVDLVDERLAQRLHFVDVRSNVNGTRKSASENSRKDGDGVGAAAEKRAAAEIQRSTQGHADGGRVVANRSEKTMRHETAADTELAKKSFKWSVPETRTLGSARPPPQTASTTTASKTAPTPAQRQPTTSAQPRRLDAAADRLPSAVVKIDDVDQDAVGTTTTKNASSGNDIKAAAEVERELALTTARQREEAACWPRMKTALAKFRSMETLSSPAPPHPATKTFSTPVQPGTAAKQRDLLIATGSDDRARSPALLKFSSVENVNSGAYRSSPVPAARHVGPPARSNVGVSKQPSALLKFSSMENVAASAATPRPSPRDRGLPTTSSINVRSTAPVFQRLGSMENVSATPVSGSRPPAIKSPSSSSSSAAAQSSTTSSEIPRFTQIQLQKFRSMEDVTAVPPSPRQSVAPLRPDDGLRSPRRLPDVPRTDVPDGRVKESDLRVTSNGQNSSGGIDAPSTPRTETPSAGCVGQPLQHKQSSAEPGLYRDAYLPKYQSSGSMLSELRNVTRRPPPMTKAAGRPFQTRTWTNARHTDSRTHVPLSQASTVGGRRSFSVGDVSVDRDPPPTIVPAATCDDSKLDGSPDQRVGGLPAQQTSTAVPDVPTAVVVNDDFESKLQPSNPEPEPPVMRSSLFVMFQTNVDPRRVQGQTPTSTIRVISMQKLIKA